MKIIGITITRTKNIDPALRLQIVRNRFLENCELVIDVGANSGQWLSKIQDSVYRKQIIAIEPVKFTFKKLSLKCGNYGNITLLNCAIGEKEGVKK
jgi:hypothetical protein